MSMSLLHWRFQDCTQHSVASPVLSEEGSALSAFWQYSPQIKHVTADCLCHKGTLLVNDQVVYSLLCRVSAELLPS